MERNEAHNEKIGRFQRREKQEKGQFFGKRKSILTGER